MTALEIRKHMKISDLDNIEITQENYWKNLKIKTWVHDMLIFSQTLRHKNCEDHISERHFIPSCEIWELGYNKR